MLESKMFKVLKEKLRYETCKIDDIETGSTEVGVPDWHLRTTNCNIWIEAKEVKHWPVRDSTQVKVKFRPGQYRWLRDHSQLGGRSLLVMTFDDVWFILDDIRKSYSVDELLQLSLFHGDINILHGDKLLLILDA